LRYGAPVSPPPPRLSRPPEALAAHYPVVIVGSGYGGAVCAARLSEAGQRVAVLERGPELQPGEFPQTGAQFRRAVQVSLGGWRVGRRHAPFDLHLDTDLGALVGCGLGGGSLINAAVAVRPDPSVFDDERWPAALRADVGRALERAYRRAEAMLRATPYPSAATPPPKLAALAAAARSLDLPYLRAPVAVSWDAGISTGGVPQAACTRCGDCCAGCNVGAKNVLTVNYLPVAAAHGAALFTGVEVDYLEPTSGGWRLYVRSTASRHAPGRVVEAGQVILAAGALGSTGVLLRSAAAGLPLSPRVGQRFSTNGDLLAFAWRTAWPTGGTGYGPRPVTAPVGTTVAGMIDLRPHGLLIQDGTIPGPLAEMLPGLLALAARAPFRPGEPETVAALRSVSSVWRDALDGPFGEAIQHTLVLLVSSVDPAEGRVELDDGRLRLRWPGVGRQSWVTDTQAVLARISGALGGTFVPNPAWRDLPTHPLLTTHPLGGCPMGEDADAGAVDHLGRVFDGRGGLHPGLYVCDGSLMPRALGANPLLTIAALAERFAEKLKTSTSPRA
jgi:cholesterol oxidase